MNLYITNGNSTVSFYLQADGHEAMGYLYYSLREAIQRYRKHEGLERKHMTVIDLRR